jgi:hypothetical protein
MPCIIEKNQLFILNLFVKVKTSEGDCSYKLNAPSQQASLSSPPCIIIKGVVSFEKLDEALPISFNIVVSDLGFA